MPVVATVLIPTFNHGPTLRHSVGSALEQTVSDIEIFIVGDGVPDVTREIVADLMHHDERVRFFDNPKGPRTGEIHRHRALAEARGEIVYYLSDDDLWLPDHVETMRDLLEEADYANALMLHLDAAGKLGVAPLDLSYPGERELVVMGRKGTSLSSMTHTLEMYRRLPYGWRTTPQEIFTDYYMQQQFLGEASCRAVSSMRPTMLKFKSEDRAGWTLDQRVSELEEWRRKFRDPAEREKFVYQVLDLLVREEVALRHRFEDSVGLRLYRLFSDLPLVGPWFRFVARGGAIQPAPAAKAAPHHARR
ncbi:MAG TPA: glycosyltransferase family 2 protein [Pyrinomonadaceae bacterium]|jgi:glycosyltransferase involved in cell wall biosynthesis